MPENCAAIIIAAKHHELIKVKDTRGTTNTVGALRCKFQFRTEDWLHSAKTAMFCNGDAVLHPEVINGAISVPLDADDECPVPYEVLTDTLPYSVGVWGITDTGLRVVSNWLVFNAQVGCYTEGNAPGDPEQTVYDEIRLISQEAVDAANEVVQRANSGEFDGKSAYELAVEDGFEGTVQEWLDSLVGVDGKDGYTPIKGVDYSDGKDGKDGYTPIKGVDYFDGVNGKDGYTPVKGVDYFDGKNGKDGADGKDGYTPVKGIDYFDGKDGTNGKDGYTPVKGVDYVDGKDGADGKDGVSVTHLWSGTTLSITSASGTSSVDLKGEKGDAPVKGKDYFTPEDVDGIVDKVLEQMPEGGVSSWNDLTDKPFGEEPIAFTWDGAISEDTIMAEVHGAPFVKVSDKVLSVSDCVGGTLVYVLRGAEGSATLPEYMIADMDGCIVAGEFNILSTANTSGVLEGQPYELPAPGTYFLAADWMFTKSLTLTSGGIKTLDEKFIPDTIARKEDLKNLGGVTSWNDLTDRPFGEEGLIPILWDGNKEGKVVVTGDPIYLVKVSDAVLSENDLIGSTYTTSDGTVTTIENVAVESDGKLLMGSFMVMSVLEANTELMITEDMSFVFPEAGTYFGAWFESAGGTYTQSLTFPGGATIKTLDEKFIPDTIARTSDVAAFDTRIQALDESVNNLAPVAKSGSFNDLKHKPSAVLTVTDDGVLCMNIVYSYDDTEYVTYDMTDNEAGLTVTQAAQAIANNNELEVI